MTISIIIHVYNVENYIRKCLDSVIAQKCDGFNIECVLVDDCIPDNSMVIVEDVVNSYHGKDVTFVILHHEVNKGLSIARNTGIDASTGDYVCFLDSDDCLMENTLHELLSYALSNPMADIVMGSSLCVGVNTTTNSAITKGQVGPVLLNDKEKLWELLLRRQIDHHVWNKLIKRPFGDQHKLYFDAGVIYEDIPWMYRVVQHVSSILVIPNLTYIYENNPNSIIHTIEKRSANVIRSFAFICKMVLENPPQVNGKTAHFVAHRLFLLHWMLFALDVRDKYGIDEETNKTLETIKRRMLGGSLKHGRILLSLNILMLFFPFNKFLKFRFVRTNVDRFNKIVYKFSWR